RKQEPANDRRGNIEAIQYSNAPAYAVAEEQHDRRKCNGLHHVQFECAQAFALQHRALEVNVGIHLELMCNGENLVVLVQAADDDGANGLMLFLPTRLWRRTTAAYACQSIELVR